jgi:hypothetical protein
MAKGWNQEDGFCPSTKLHEWCKWRICNWFCMKQKLTLYIQFNRNSDKCRFCYSLDTEEKFKIQTRYSSRFLYGLLNSPPHHLGCFTSVLRPANLYQKVTALETSETWRFIFLPRNKWRSLTLHSFHCVNFFFLRSSGLKRSADWI